MRERLCNRDFSFLPMPLVPSVRELSFLAHGGGGGAGGNGGDQVNIID